jgi:pilus assembly protein Flp/PilA
MTKLMNMTRRFRDDESGAAMVEYSILVGIIAGAAILAIVAIGLWVTGRFTGLCSVMGNAAVSAATGGSCDAAASAYTRPANTTAYTANDAVSNNGTAGSVTAISLSLSDVNDDTVTLERIRILSTDTGVQGKNFRVWLFNSDPTANSGVGGGDNAAWSQKQAGFIGSMSGTFRAFSDGAGAVCIPDEGTRIITAPVTGAKTVFALLQTLDAFTPSANSTTFTLTAEGFQGAA